MNSLYLILDILTIIFPFLLSFDKKVAFYKDWKYVSLGLLFIGIPFVLWDIGFTYLKVWGFNPAYLTGINIGNLPIEEVLFFVVVPFSCVFIYACVKAYFPKIRLAGFNKVFYALLAIYCIAVMVFGFGGYYSMSASILALLTIPFLTKSKLDLKFLPLAFMISLIPFFIVNGILTGTGLDEPIVWYDNSQNAGMRFFTIPIEDVVYGWTLIAGNIFVYQHFLGKNAPKKKKRRK